MMEKHANPCGQEAVELFSHVVGRSTGIAKVVYVWKFNWLRDDGLWIMPGTEA